MCRHSSVVSYVYLLIAVGALHLPIGILIIRLPSGSC